MEELTVPGEIQGQPVIRIGSDAFASVRSTLTKLVLPDTVTDLREICLTEMPQLMEVKLPASLEILDAAVLYHCPQLTEVTPPPTVYYVGMNSRSFCDQLRAETFTGPVPFFSYEYGITLSAEGAVVYVPDDLLEEYRAALLDAAVQPSGQNAVIPEWSSPEEDFTVDENGCLTAYRGHATRVTVPASVSGTTPSRIASCWNRFPIPIPWISSESGHLTAAV